MKQLYLLLIITGISFTACRQEQKTSETMGYSLVHVVYFKVKKEADRQKLIAELRKLEAIEVLKELQIGSFKDLGDARALSDYSLVMQMGFASEADYRTYQNHPVHLALKAAIGDYLAGPPATYDYELQN